LTGLNLLGVRPTGHAALALAVVALLPVAALTVVALVGPRVAPWTPLAPAGQGVETLGFGLAVLMWNYSGWDTPSTILGETRAPERAFRSAMFLTLPILIAAYLLPVGAALASGALPWSEWTTGVLPTIARSVGGDWLGHAVAAGAVLSTAGLFMSLLLTNSRLPYVLARDHAMPRWLGAVDARFGTPWTAVVVSAALYAAFAVFSFKELIVLNIWLYSLSLLVELAAFVRLRVSAPAMPRHRRGPEAARAIRLGRPPRARRRDARGDPAGVLAPRPGGRGRRPRPPAAEARAVRRVDLRGPAYRPHRFHDRRDRLRRDAPLRR